jgi:hypothetical protein
MASFPNAFALAQPFATSRREPVNVARVVYARATQLKAPVGDV